MDTIFKHYLNFRSIPSVGRIEIAEPIGFDKASYEVKQDTKRFGRDIIVANRDTEFTFWREHFTLLDSPQVLPNGKDFEYASQGFEYIKDVYNNEGYEGEIEYILSVNGVDFSIGYFDMYTIDVQLEEIKVKILQNTKREELKRNEDTYIDAFSNTDLNGATITPCETTNILLKAKPVHQISKWVMGYTSTQDFTYTGDYSFNLSNSVIDYGVDDTLSYLIGVGDSEQFIYLRATNNLSSGVLKITNLNVSVKFATSLYLAYGLDLGTATIVTLQSVSNFGTFTGDITYTFPDMPIGYKVWIYFKANLVNEVIYRGMDVEMSFNSTSIDTVIKGVRLIDLIKHNIKSNCGLDTVAPTYDIGGEHYDNFVFNGYLLGQITDKPFNNKFKDLIGCLDETCSDYQLNPNGVQILPYSGFYTNTEIGVFSQLPDNNNSQTFNKLYAIKKAEFNYKNSSADKEVSGQNTLDDVHTKTQWLFPNKKVDGTLKIEIDHIRSQFLIEEARRRAFDNKQTSSMQNDDKLFIQDCVPLAPSSKGGFSSILLMRVMDTGNVQILNNNTDADGIAFNWTLLGFGLGSLFTIESGDNAGNYTVFSINNSVLELTPIGFTPSYNGDSFIKISYFLTDVHYTNRTSEGFTLIEGVQNAYNYGNLNYSIKRNLQRWFPYFATATKFRLNSGIVNTFFKNNGKLVTKKTGESDNVVDKDNIITNEIASYKILNPQIHKVKVFADFDVITQLLSDIQTIKGYVRVLLNDGRLIKGYVANMNYLWQKGELSMELEEKYVSDFIEITADGVSEVGYSEKINLDSFQINNIFVSLFDVNQIPLINPTRFENILINGVQYSDITEFSDALTTLLDA